MESTGQIVLSVAYTVDKSLYSATVLLFATASKVPYLQPITLVFKNQIAMQTIKSHVVWQ